MNAVTARKRGAFALILTIAAVAAGACRSDVSRALRPSSPRERYAEILRDAGFADRALFQEWQAAGQRAVDSAPLLEAPFRESGYLSPERADARGYRVAVRRGQLLQAVFAIEGTRAGVLFADLFEVADSGGPVLAASADSGATTFTAEIEEDGAVVLRIQPELLSGGRYSLTVQLLPVLAFPVGGAARDAIRSRFGAQRDGGRRNHEGIDIFAPRGSPVLAAERGVATWVGDNELGGRVIMVRDRERAENHYYAHLDAQLVNEGDLVERGDTIGLVGNSGNARTTPPHLHFGIYARGAVDPYPYVALPDTAAAPLGVPPERIGEWLRVGRRPGILLTHPDGDTLRLLDPGTVARALAGTARWYRVRLPDRLEGFLAADRADAATALRRLGRGARILEAPDSASVVMLTAGPGDRAEVVGRFAGFDLVRIDGTGHGWASR